MFGWYGKKINQFRKFLKNKNVLIKDLKKNWGNTKDIYKAIYLDIEIFNINFCNIKNNETELIYVITFLFQLNQKLYLNNDKMV